MKGIKIAALIVAGMATFNVTTSALAAVAAPMGWYVEGNVGTSRLNNYSNGRNTSIDNGSGFGWNVDAGYKFMPYFGAEIGYTAYGNANINNSGGVKAATVKSRYSYDLAAKGMLPITDSGFELFGKLGIARLHVNAADVGGLARAANIGVGTQNKTGGYIALGGDYSFMPNLAANLQWARAQGGKNSTGNADLFSLGVTYLFC